MTKSEVIWHNWSQVWKLIRRIGRSAYLETNLMMASRRAVLPDT